MTWVDEINQRLSDYDNELIEEISQGFETLMKEARDRGLSANCTFNPIEKVWEVELGGQKRLINYREISPDGIKSKEISVKFTGGEFKDYSTRCEGKNLNDELIELLLAKF